MRKHDILYIGELPPPYGGVAVKNKLVLQHVFFDLDLHMIDLVECRRSPMKIPIVFCRLITGMRSGAPIVIGVGTNQRLKILLLMQKLLCGVKGLKRVMILVMGGQFHRDVASDARLFGLLKRTGSIWVETRQMADELTAMRLKQVGLFPNCRTRECALPPTDCREDRPLRLVFFSRICVEKGIDDIMRTTAYLAESGIRISLDFYGELEDGLQADFERYVSRYDNIHYHGVFDSTRGDVYQELNQYDIILLPTRWKGEGIPGAIVESKMAGIAAIVSDWNFNRELVVHEKEGIVINPPYEKSLSDAVIMLDGDREKLLALKQGAFSSRFRYSIDQYRDRLCSALLNDVNFGGNEWTYKE